MKKLNLGCGKDIRKGYVNLDTVKLKGVDVVQDLEKFPWSLKNNEFDEVYCDNVLEHLSDIIKPMEELWRITKNGGKIIVKVPIFPSVWAATDPTHRSFYSYVTFNYFREGDGLNYYSKARFKILKRKIEFGRYTQLWNTGIMEWLVNLCEMTKKIYYFYFSFLIPASSLYVELEPIKK
ncbi:MAG: methyltransferase domain-containing protein [Nanoarchaeota archaeon]